MSWYRESARHSKAARGIKTGRKGASLKLAFKSKKEELEYDRKHSKHKYVEVFIKSPDSEVKEFLMRKFGHPLSKYFEFRTHSDYDAAINPHDGERVDYDVDVEWKSPREALLEQYRVSGSQESGTNFADWKDTPTRSAGYIEHLISETKKPEFKGFPAVYVVKNPDGTYEHLQEGRHRLIAMETLGEKEVPIVVFTKRPIRDRSDELWYKEGKGFGKIEIH